VKWNAHVDKVHFKWARKKQTKKKKKKKKQKKKDNTGNRHVKQTNINVNNFDVKFCLQDPSQGAHNPSETTDGKEQLQNAKIKTQKRAEKNKTTTPTHTDVKNAPRERLDPSPQQQQGRTNSNERKNKTAKKCD
jgi:hypothetical protein